MTVTCIMTNVTTLYVIKFLKSTNVENIFDEREFEGKLVVTVIIEVSIVGLFTIVSDLGRVTLTHSPVP